MNIYSSKTKISSNVSCCPCICTRHSSSPFCSNHNCTSRCIHTYNPCRTLCSCMRIYHNSCMFCYTFSLICFVYFFASDFYLFCLNVNFDTYKKIHSLIYTSRIKWVTCAKQFRAKLKCTLFFILMSFVCKIHIHIKIRISKRNAFLHS